ncbi:MAG: outer membrane lipoprotein-sorting protein [Ignavibacteria bacterium]|nr:outer membrane lipoprotein-sorting protein [Ignavibacteria bacterium]
MKYIISALIFFIICNLSLAQTAEEIIRKSEDLIKGNSAHGTFQMNVVTPDYTRTLKMESWWVGNDKALIVIKSPKKEAGNKTLKIKNEMWNYLRNTETTIKVPPSMMLQSWNGSDFTNDDLVRESNLSEDYYTEIVAIEQMNGEEYWKIKLDPKPNATVVWGKLYYWVMKKNYLPAIIQYYDEKGNLIREMHFSNVKKFGKRRIPSVWTMYKKTEEGYYTSFKILSTKFDIKIDDRIFSFEELEKGD